MFILGLHQLNLQAFYFRNKKNSKMPQNYMIIDTICWMHELHDLVEKPKNIVT